jgi:hypothetical protein
LPVAAIAILARQLRRIARAAGEEAVLEIAHVASSGAYIVRGLGRIAPPLALAGAIVEMGRALGGGGGLVALQRGLAARVALERACLSLGIGVVTALLCFAAASRLARRARQASAEIARRLDRPGPDV